MLDFLQNTYKFGNSLLDYCIALILSFFVIIIIRLFEKYIIKRFHIWITSSNQHKLYIIIDSFSKRFLPITYIISVYSGISYLKLPEVITSHINQVTTILISFFVILFVGDLIRDLAQFYKKDKRKNIPPGIISITQFLVWVIGILFVFANLGYNVSTFITGIGIGGVAIALASQAILGDLFNYFVILFDKPFIKGDMIKIDDKEGTIEYIGIKSTRIRSITGELLLISNTDLTKSRLHNYKDMKKRRFITKIGVEYSTPKDKLKEIPKLLTNIVNNIDETEISRVYFSEFGDSSLNFELAYFVLSKEYIDYVNTIEKVNYAIIDSFDKEGINFAFPTRTVLISKS